MKRQREGEWARAELRWRVLLFNTQKKEQWMSDWLNEWEAGWSWEGLWLCGSAEVNSASSEGWKGEKTDWALKRRTPCAWGGISQDDLLEWESERERRLQASKSCSANAALKSADMHDNKMGMIQILISSKRGAHTYKTFNHLSCCHERERYTKTKQELVHMKIKACVFGSLFFKCCKQKSLKDPL